VNIKSKIGQRIRDIRYTKNISQEELGHLAELDRTYITSVENGKRNISIVNIEKICNALKMPLEDFFRSKLFK
jgi:transcriptional regulator with XRE-family HTH domain